MKTKPELIIEIGAEGGSFSAYRVKQENETWSFHFGTNEMGLDDEDWGISTRSKDFETDFNTFLKKIRTKYPEIYNLFPLYVHPEYSNAVLYDLRFRMKINHFDYERWAAVLFLKINGFEMYDTPEKERELAEAKLRQTLKHLDTISPRIKDEKIVSARLEKLARIEERKLAKKRKEEIEETYRRLEEEEEVIPVYDGYNYFKALSDKDLVSFYRCLVYSNPGRLFDDMIQIEKILTERINARGPESAQLSVYLRLMKEEYERSRKSVMEKTVVIWTKKKHFYKRVCNVVDRLNLQINEAEREGHVIAIPGFYIILDAAVINDKLIGYLQEIAKVMDDHEQHILIIGGFNRQLEKPLSDFVSIREDYPDNTTLKKLILEAKEKCPLNKTGNN